MIQESNNKRVDMCCMGEVRWKGQGASFAGTSEQRYKLWSSGNDAESGGDEILVKKKYLVTLWKLEKKATE